MGDPSVTSSVANIRILNEHIRVTGGSDGAGIGSEYAEDGGSSSVETLSIQGGTIRARGPHAGIGPGNGGQAKSLVFSGSAMLLCDATTEERFPVNADSIALADASLILQTPRDPLFGRSPSRQGELNLTIIYGGVTSENPEPLSALNATFLQIGNISLPRRGSWTFCVSMGAEQGS
jgi:hypothetical protein